MSQEVVYRYEDGLLALRSYGLTNRSGDHYTVTVPICWINFPGKRVEFTSVEHVLDRHLGEMWARTDDWQWEPEEGTAPIRRRTIHELGHTIQQTGHQP